jgi:outer membrane biosynthesis protein TonB
VGRRPVSDRHRTFRTRLLVALAASLALLVALVVLWPVPRPGAALPVVFDARGTERIEVQEIVPTRQARRRPPPPAPLPPVVVPDDAVIEPEPITFVDANRLPLVDAPGEDDEAREGTTEGDARAARPDTEPRLLLSAVARTTPAARDAGVRARVEVEVRVDARGQVVEAHVRERWLLGSDGEPVRTVEALGYGLEEAALRAARRSRFRPARAGDEAVPARTTLTIRFSS